ncbi:bifunctional 3-(3-hydroxy-phenyl)propionate/3-hydroxycinnamic acid hydroxylase [Streptomyces sp. NBC_00102]|uniref:bifunctional 3-(3-hydroxy-phenyl)propionate/3-hydroxycinnamic acid hydroxylase MhpA n=1 Tax=Streptomyces sp. NBC_00102 TaxID=2975652 RepID=UPI0022579AF2|nr:bifunctional 3-(3-hydroxy-phenyl)propionate/3-hydroxycinnamic acid hydroxylase [Streptomyces sp. NBC_00102]MCX5399883.1 bifunctional 3-(3-hydroxy-phenyl)propionate/3-hydroxycinnamic acid hydroxylase [Streptomyces sp. NBC_00102]
MSPVAERTQVLVVGYGPVGQLLSVLLAQDGTEVTVLERWPRPYPRPRAVAFDGESARILASAGLGERVGAFGEPSGDYSWLDENGEELMHYEAHGPGLSGWPDSTSMYQPGLEEALAGRGAELPSLRLLRGYEAVGLAQPDGDGPVTVEAVGEDGGRIAVTADWVVGCDGANSFVRRHMDADFEDLGFRHDWLICDIVPRTPRTYRPNNLQVCDPARPRTAVSAGPGHRRWEFMKLDSETPEELDKPDTVWRLLGEVGVGPGDAELERHAVYTFEAKHARRWRSGRLLLAGDSAHLMPPFAAQGMSSGFRDAANLAWKLRLVLTGRAGEDLLDTYTEERREHVRHAIGMSVSLGRVICQTDPETAREQAELMKALRRRSPGPARQPSAVAPLLSGFLHRGGTGSGGELTPQGRVAADGRAGLFDEVSGTGFVLLTSSAPDTLLDAERSAALAALGVRTVWVRPAGSPHPSGPETGTGTVEDVEDVYLPYLAGKGAVAAVVRPDFYLYGAAADGPALAALLDGLAARLAV